MQLNLALGSDIQKRGRRQAISPAEARWMFAAMRRMIVRNAEAARRQKEIEFLEKFYPDYPRNIYCR